MNARATTGGATSGGATTGGATSGGATSGGATSGGAGSGRGGNGDRSCVGNGVVAGPSGVRRDVNARGRGGGGGGAQAMKQVVAVAVGHADVADDHVRPAVGQGGQGLVGVGGQAHRRAVLAEQPLDQPAGVGLVVDRQHVQPLQHARPFGNCSGVGRGRGIGGRALRGGRCEIARVARRGCRGGRGGRLPTSRAGPTAAAVRRRVVCRRSDGRAAGATGVIRGRRTTNVDPASRPALWTWTRPPCNSTSCRTIARPSPSPAVTTRDRRVGLAEAVEDERHELRVNPLPAVDDLQLDLRPERRQRHRHTPAGRGEFDGVAEQVPKHLLQPVAVGQNHGRVAIGGWRVGGLGVGGCGVGGLVPAGGVPGRLGVGKRGVRRRRGGWGRRVGCVAAWCGWGGGRGCDAGGDCVGGDCGVHPATRLPLAILRPLTSRLPMGFGRRPVWRRLSPGRLARGPA